MLIDSHCHINSLNLTQQNSFFLSDLSDSIFIDSSIDYETFLISLKLSTEHKFVYTALGFHPFSAEKYDPGIIKLYEELIDNNKKIAAVGEIGLDYKAAVSIEKQEAIFKEFIALAKRKNLPIQIHNRLKDYERILPILDDFYSDYSQVILHCFSYPAAFLKKLITKGAYISFSLNILRKNKDIIDSLTQCPLENLLLETDSPYMRIDDRASTPLDIKEVYSFIAKLKNTDIKLLEDIINTNAKKIFNLSKGA